MSAAPPPEGPALDGLAGLPARRARRPSRRALRVLRVRLIPLAWLAALLLPVRPAAAHQTSMKQLELRVAERSAELTLRASFDDVASAVGRDPAGLPRAELLADPGVLPTLTGWVRLSAGDAPCAAQPASLRDDDRDARYLVARWRVDCPQATHTLTFDLTSFFTLDATHTMVLHFEGQGASLDTVIGVDDSPLTVRLTSPPRSFLRWMRLGMDHIFGGADHLCFVITLLISAVLVRAPDRRAGSRRPDGGTSSEGRAGTWQVRSLRMTLRSSALLITAFSVAHSLTLLAASLGWVVLPSRLVETVIAASIVYAAAENALRPDAPRRWMLVFGFGLIHGLGFASALRELLSSDRVIVSLLAFNLGVEVGQLVVVTIALPLLLGLAKVLGPDRYRARFLPLSSILLGSLALMWSLERAFDLAFW
jgi:hypothetical protein